VHTTHTSAALSEGLVSKTKEVQSLPARSLRNNSRPKGLKRVRFMAKSPDGRIFVTDMFNRTDNQKGAVYILDAFDTGADKFNKGHRLSNKLRNPNSIAFLHRSERRALVLSCPYRPALRYRYWRGDDAPSGAPKVIATFPDYGLNYKYGAGI